MSAGAFFAMVVVTAIAIVGFCYWRGDAASARDRPTTAAVYYGLCFIAGVVMVLVLNLWPDEPAIEADWVPPQGFFAGGDGVRWL